MFEAQLFTAEISETKFVIRVLKMKESFFIYVAPQAAESFDSLSLAMETHNGELLRTNILESEENPSCADLAFKLSKKLKRPVYLSCSGIEDRFIQPALVTFLFSEVCPKII